MIELFKAGTQTSSSGETKEWSVERLKAIADTYNSKVAEQGDTAKAPIVIGHPKDNDQAYGWIKTMTVDEQRGVLLGEPEQVDPSIKEAVDAGKYKKGSISFYRADSEANPAKDAGVEFPRHFGLLGAMAPAVKGLAAVSFSEAKEGDVIEYGDYDDMVNASMWRSLREWIIGKFSREDADQAVPGWNVSAVEAAALTEDSDDSADGVAQPAFSEDTSTATTTVETTTEAAATVEAVPAQTASADFSEAEARLSAKEAELRAREAALIARENEDFCESLINNGGRILPAQKAQVMGLLNALSATTQTVDFAEGEVSAADALKAILGGLPPHVEFSEVAKEEPVKEPQPLRSVTLPANANVNAEQLALLAKAEAFQAQNPGVSLADAIKKVYQS